MSFLPQALRKDYLHSSIDETSVNPDPFKQFQTWLDDAIRDDLIEANAMIVATVGPDGNPSVRTVLLKDFSPAGFVFTTSYDSPKSRDIAGNPQIALLFYWPALERQVRITGTAAIVTSDESDEFFGKRPVDARISSMISPQSDVVPGREWLEERVRNLKGSLGDRVPTRPDTWGGFRVTPDQFEFWQGRKNRLHDRIRFVREESAWIIERLAP